jgi:hypothetical protein
VVISFPSGNAETVPSSDTTRDFPDLAPGESFTVTWDVLCTGEGLTTIMVDAYSVSLNESIPIDNYDEVDVMQQDKAHLVARILSPENDMWYAFSNEIPLEIEVENTGTSCALDVTVDVRVEGLASRWPDGAKSFTLNVGDLAGGESKVVEEVLHCDGPCTVVISAYPEGFDPCGNWWIGADHHNTDSDSVTIHQMPFKVTIVQFPNEVETGSTFGVHAEIINTCIPEGEEGPEDCVGCCETPPLVATINIKGFAELAMGETPSKDVTPVPLGQGHEVEWTLKCTAPGMVKVDVTVVVDREPGESGDPLGTLGPELGYEVSSTSDYIAIWQKPRLKGFWVQLCKDWNYVSLPVIPVTTEITDVLRNVMGAVDEVWTWDAEAGEWLAYFPGGDGRYGDVKMLHEMKDGVGYLIEMTYPRILLGEGYVLPPNPVSLPPEYPLQKGWNLIGYKAWDWDDPWPPESAERRGYCRIDPDDTVPAGLYLKNLGGGCDECSIIGNMARYLRTFDCGYPGQWRDLKDCDLMTVGQAYWLYATEEGMSIVPPQAGRCEAITYCCNLDKRHKLPYCVE